MGRTLLPASPRVAALLLGVAALGLCRRAVADPRWWWSDRAITATAVPSVTPHLAAAVGANGVSGGAGLFVVYAEQDPDEGDWEIWLSATFDAGCTFCPPVRLTDNPVDDTRPRIAVDAGGGALQVVFERGGDAWVAWDVGTLRTIDDTPAQCARLVQVADHVRAGQSRPLSSVPGTASRPDITWGRGHFHAAWEDVRAGGGQSDIYHARDLVGEGGAGWVDERNLTPGAAAPRVAREPVIGTDNLALPELVPCDPPCSTVNVVFVDTADGSAHYLRSIDSGTTFSADGSAPPTPPATISDAGSVARRPALDSASNPWISFGPTWHFVAWADFRSGDPAPTVMLDAGHHRDSQTLDVPWLAPDLQLAPTTDAGDGGPAVSLHYNFDPELPAYVFWADSRLGARELFYRGGRMRATGPDMSVFPIPALRDLDPRVSADTLLSACEVDEATLDCASSRAAGDASSPASLEDFDQVYVAWADSRDGASNIYFKRTDRQVRLDDIVLVPRCVSPSATELVVSFAPPRSCTDAFPTPERVRRYLVYHGTDPGGPYANAAAPIDVRHEDITGLRAEIVIGGLAPATTYTVVVVPEDEARNLLPPDFDPTRDAPDLHYNEREATTPDPCEPWILPSSFLAAERCPAAPALSGDGERDFGEEVDLTLVLRNAGSLAATSYSAQVLATNARVDLPAGGVVTIARLEPGQSVAWPVRVRVDAESPTFRCGDLVDLTLFGQTSDGGAWTWPDDPLSGSDFAVGSPTAGCGTCPAGPAIVVAGVRLVADTCPLDPAGAGAGNGVIDPAERVTLEIDLLNGGDLPATALLGAVRANLGATVAAGGSIGPLDVPVGTTGVHAVVLDVTAACGDVIDLDVIGLASDGGAFTFADDTASGDRRTGSNVRPVVSVFEDGRAFLVDDPGTARSILGVEPDVTRRVERARLQVEGFFDAASARLIMPGGTRSAGGALNGSLDVTADYNGAAGGPGRHDIEVTDLINNGVTNRVDTWRIVIDDMAADCVTCRPPCAAFDFAVTPVAVPGRDCRLDVSWPAAGGEPPVTYDVFRDGVRVASGMTTTTYEDGPLAWGAAHVYEVEARDACANPSPRSGRSAASLPVTPVDSTAPLVTGEGATYAGAGAADCEVTLRASIVAGCAPLSGVEVLRGLASPPTAVVASGVTLPHVDVVPGDATWYYVLRARDAAGNVTDSAVMSVDVSACGALPSTCLYRGTVASPGPVPPAMFLVPPTAEGLSLDVTAPEVSSDCPFSSGDLDPRGDVAGDGTWLTFYQVNVAADTLRVRREGSRLRLDF